MNVYVSVFILSFHSPVRLVEEAEEPEGYLVVVAYLGVVAGVDGVFVETGLASSQGVADFELALVVDDIGLWLGTLVDEMVFPHGVDEESLHQLLAVHLDGIDGIHEIGVVHHDAGRLLGKFHVGVVHDVEQACVGEVFDIVHHRGAAGIDLLSQLADVGCLESLYGEEIEKLLNLGEVFELYLLDEEDVDLYHHVHGLEKILGEVAVLKEERVEAVVEVFLKIRLGTYLGENLLGDMLVVVDNLVKGVGPEVGAGSEIEIFAEGETAEIVELQDVLDGRIVGLQAHDAGACEDNLQVGIVVITFPKLHAPVGLLENLVQEQHLAALLDKLSCKIGDAMALKVEVVHVDIETLSVVFAKLLLGVG